MSIFFATAVHNCFCGCGSKVVTPIKPAGWELTYDGDTVSLWPAVGSWGLPCRSHYIIRKDTRSGGNVKPCPVPAKESMVR